MFVSLRFENRVSYSLAHLCQTDIIVCDLVPLASRGAFYGIIGSVWALASAIVSLFYLVFCRISFTMLDHHRVRLSVVHWLQLVHGAGCST